MKFEKEFPSLKGEGLCNVDINCLKKEDNVFLAKDIQKHCLDKEKVRNAIAYYEKQGVGRYEDFKEWLKAELELNTQTQTKEN